jgi:hypothetical protein
MKCKVSLAIGLVLAGLSITAVAALAASKAPAGQCGEYKYWHEGKCLDARNAPSGKTWADEMLAKKWGP